MPILENVELFFPRLDPQRPNAKFNKSNPTWEVQIRTRDKKVAAEWKKLTLKVTPGDDEDGIFYRVNLRKRSKKKDGEPQNPVTVIGGDLSEIDPTTIGNGSKANVRIFQYDYVMDGKTRTGTMLMAIQITELNEYIPKPREDEFGVTNMKVNRIADNQENDEDMEDDIEDDLDDEIPF
jgi:hypothetical protein